MEDGIEHTPSTFPTSLVVSVFIFVNSLKILPGFHLNFIYNTLHHCEPVRIGHSIFVYLVVFLKIVHCVTLFLKPLDHGLGVHSRSFLDYKSCHHCTSISYVGCVCILIYLQTQQTLMRKIKYD